MRYWFLVQALLVPGLAAAMFNAELSDLGEIASFKVLATSEMIQIPTLKVVILMLRLIFFKF